MIHKPEVKIARGIEPKSAGKTWVFKGAVDADQLELHVATRLWAEILLQYGVNNFSFANQIPSGAITEVEAIAQQIVDQDGPPDDGVLVILRRPS
jgi:hypothetical protein